MRRDHRGFRCRDGIPECLIRHVRDIDDHAEAIHLQHDLLAELGEAIVMLYFRIDATDG